MPAIDDHLGVQSYCFRAFKDNHDVARMVREIGVSAIEVCGVHADFSDPDGFAKVVDIYKDAGVEVLSIGVQTFTGDTETERRWFECAQVAGAKHISCHFNVDTYLDAIPKVQKLCDEFGIRAAIHSHGGYHFCGALGTIRHLVKLGAPQIGVCIDTAWAMQTGPHQGNPVDWANKLAGHVYGIHYKDFVFDRNAQWNDVVVGEGNLDLPAFVEAIDAGGFDGFAVIEYEADVDNPVPALTRCVDAMKSAVASA